MAEFVPPLFGGRKSSDLSRSFDTGQKQGTRTANLWPVGIARPAHAARPQSPMRTEAGASDSRAVVVALLWLVAFAAAELLLNRPQFMPTVPGTELRLLSMPMALFALALMLRPASEAPLYAL